MSYTIPSTEQLKEFYLCGIRTGFLKETSIPTLVPNKTQLKAYNCDYCPAWHRVPEHADEAELLHTAQEKFVSHLDMLFYEPSKSRTEVPTSSVIILGVN